MVAAGIPATKDLHVLATTATLRRSRRGVTPQRRCEPAAPAYRSTNAILQRSCGSSKCTFFGSNASGS